ncbi:MAG: hypothetical protein JWM04_1503 [Verrucomicrobiales bacterium]|nr:hypothetical protein [Verrucomicrobiales bacterium]
MFATEKVYRANPMPLPKSQRSRRFLNFVGSLATSGNLLLVILITGFYSKADDFSDRIADRAVIDAYGALHQQTDARLEPAAYLPPKTRKQLGGFVSIQSPPLEKAELNYWTRWNTPIIPPSAFKAPFDPAGPFSSPQFPTNISQPPKVSRATAFIQKQLASLGLIETLAQSLIIIGPGEPIPSGANEQDFFLGIGIPFDFLQHFHSPRNLETYEYIKQCVQANPNDSAALHEALKQIEFRYKASKPGLSLSLEDGTSDPSLLRLQMGGGFRKGIIPGGSIEVSEHLLQAFTNANVVLTTPTEITTNLASAANSWWKLSRSNQLVFITTPYPLVAWAQDNGKPAFYINSSNKQEHVTIIPRFASQGESVTTWFPGENAALNLFAKAGHSVIQSPLLFQGGNLLMIRNPATREKILITSETEIHRNIALGLNRTQVIEAFRTEFGGDRIVVLPLVSFHLDYDISIRVVGKDIYCLVNDPVSMAGLIVDKGISQLLSASKINPARAEILKTKTHSEKPGEAMREIQIILKNLQGPTGAYPASLAKLFAVQPSDAATFNLQIFCTAVDILEATDPRENSPTPASYLRSLKRTLDANEALHDELRKLEWKLIAVPSMPDLYKSANYLNGIQGERKFVMPGLGGYYSWLDSLVQSKIETALGNQITVEILLCADLQQNHGALHCV